MGEGKPHTSFLSVLYSCTLYEVNCFEVASIFFVLQYDEYKSPMDNIGMQDSLLSRFDMIFVVLDEMDPDHDRRISEHVLRMHRYRNPGEQVRTAMNDRRVGVCINT